MTRRVLMLSPHFPPDSRAGAHRVRLLAPHLPANGWEPVVVAVQPQYYEARMDQALADLLPRDLRIVRTPAVRPGFARQFGVGDVGVRSMPFLYAACRKLLARERFDMVYITTYPIYPALLGRRLLRRFGVPFVIDYQDPWVGSWGRDVGPDGRANRKSRVARGIAARVEPRAIGRAAGITAVSRGTWDDVVARLPQLKEKPFLELPIGGDARDFEVIRDDPQPNGLFDPSDGNFHLVYVGTVLPKGLETVRGFLEAVRRFREESPDLFRRLRIHFVGSSNLTAPDAAPRVLPMAEALGIAGCVHERPPRVPYVQALRVLTQASAILLMGSSERHYTASKLYPALLARRPLLALYHEASTVSEILPRAVAEPSAGLVKYGDDGAAPHVDKIASRLTTLVCSPTWNDDDVDPSEVERWSAARLSGTLARFLDALVDPGTA